MPKLLRLETSGLVAGGRDLVTRPLVRFDEKVPGR